MQKAIIREYQPEDQENFKRFYVSLENKKKRTRVLHALQKRTSAKRAWQAGIVGVLGIHLSQWAKSATVLKSTTMLILEILLWSAGIGFVWYRWISREYDTALVKACEHIATELGSMRKSEKSNAWVAEKDGQLVGTVALKYEDKGEGKVGFLTGLESQTRLMLVQNAIKFGRTNKIEVISKWQNETKWSESPF
jgi:hypothetical protein